MSRVLCFVLAAFALATNAAAFEFIELEVIPEFMTSTHYGNPGKGCMPDEVAIRIQDVKGGICSPPCKAFSCPSDVPDGVSAKPQCVLQDGATKKKYCALVCKKGMCGAGASCKMIGPVGICTYDLSQQESFE
mmetsp:Transcript_12190/g.15153  ORF Transcript_12190/g.15153 Transcript_12190/m.15153 type:complete len:133 (-) Transcript_12190:90-488(-)